MEFTADPELARYLMETELRIRKLENDLEDCGFHKRETISIAAYIVMLVAATEPTTETIMEGIEIIDKGSREWTRETQFTLPNQVLQDVINLVGGKG